MDGLGTWLDGPEGTVWNAFVTSDADILVGGAMGPAGGGVPPQV